uniref:hypothetical protein n=1 Tax=Parasutterella excrementihominis TaxID=487175 RepID=UPI003FEE8A3C
QFKKDLRLQVFLFYSAKSGMPNLLRSHKTHLLARYSVTAFLTSPAFGTSYRNAHVSEPFVLRCEEWDYRNSDLLKLIQIFL